MPESLQIVGEELAITLNDARLALEQFAEGEGGPNVLDRCVGLLHTARGVLRMTETYGASLLAEEMELACRHLGGMRGNEGNEEAIDALSRAAVQLPAYVERILNGGRDIPLVLLPLLNDLRAVRGKPLLSESTLLLLNVFTPAEEVEQAQPREASGENLQQLCAASRSRFQLALLGWIKGADAARNLSIMGEIAGKLEAAATHPEIFRLWWVTAGVLEGLAGGGVETSVSVKRLIGQVDREMKRLISMGEERCGSQPPHELINNLLYYIARGQNPGPRVTAIREAYKLEDLVPADSQVEAVRESLAAPSAKLMETVADAIREDLARVKDVLDIYVRTGMEHVEELLPQAELLKKIGDTLGVLGLGDLRETVELRRTELVSIASGESAGDESNLVAMAAALLGVERRLDDQLFGLIAPSDSDESGDQDADEDDVDYLEVSRAVMRECIVNLARVKDAVSQVVEHPEEGAILDSVPPLLQGVTAGLLVLENPAAVEIVEGIGTAITNIIQHGYATADRRRLDMLADSIVSLDYYLETLEAGRREPLYMLENAQRCLTALVDISEDVAVPDASPQERDLAKTVAIDKQPSATVQVLDPRALDVSPGLESQADRPDPEIIELFIEEAGEEIEAIKVNFPAWSENPANEDALTVLRRSFHTLKGSGRMVGATFISDTAWGMENLLNRVINQTLEPTPELMELLAEGIAALPELLEQLEVGTQPKFDVGEFSQRASFMAEGRVDVALPSAGDSPDLDLDLEFADETDEGQQDESIDLDLADEVPETAEADESIDSVLLDILTKEVAAHVDAIELFIEEARQGIPPFAISEEMYRACHTLHGSVTMAKADAAARLTGPLNQLVRHAYDHPVSVDVPVIDAVEATVVSLQEVIAALAAGDDNLPQTDALVAELQALDEAVEATAAARAELAKAEEAEIRPADEEVGEPETEAEPVSGAADFDPDIAEIFAEEAAELLEGCDAVMAQISDEAVPEASMAELQRHLHTVKGGARMAGLVDMGDFSHDLEALLIGINSGRLPMTGDTRELLQASIDELHSMREQVVAGQAPARPGALMQRLASTLSGDALESTDAVELPPMDVAVEQVSVETLEPEELTAVDEAELEPADQELEAAESEEEVAPEEEEASALDADTEEEQADETGPALPVMDQIGQLARDLEAPPSPASGGLDFGSLPSLASSEAATVDRRQLARVDPKLLEQLLNNAGEISIFHSRLSQQMSRIHFNLVELGQTVTRLREQLRGLEIATEAQIHYQHQVEGSANEDFDPLELDRYSRIQQLSLGLTETASDVGSLKDLLQNLTSDTEALLVQQARTATELQDGLMRTRMVPFHGHATRLSRLVRQTAAESGKQAELSLRGGGDLDRQVLEKMLPPFEHLLRNAVIHGIETPEQREAAGKPATGNVVITLRREGAEVVIDVEDDGRGLDVEAIRQKAHELGLLDPARDASDEEVMQYILRPGVSTAERLTQVAGRGIGMDVVASEMTKLGGSLRIDSTPGQGTRFILRLPFTLAVTQAMVVRVGQEQYALPLPTVEGIIRISRDDFDNYMAEEDPVIDYGDQRYAFRYLGQYLGHPIPRIPEDEERISLILVRAGENSAALIADEMLDSREIVVKPVGDQLSTIRGISGATILGDGSVVVILDAGALVRSGRLIPESEIPQAAEVRPPQPLALVVDDSITMRRVTQRLLERNDFMVITAKDGVEAVSVLQDHVPDIILLDIEMPRMDGYEFATYVRGNEASEAVPIIMVTSRVSDKHRARAIELGVNDYLGKPYQEQELMEAVRHLLKMPAE